MSIKLKESILTQSKKYVKKIQFALLNEYVASAGKPFTFSYFDFVFWGFGGLAWSSTEKEDSFFRSDKSSSTSDAVMLKSEEESFAWFLCEDSALRDQY